MTNSQKHNLEDSIKITEEFLEIDVHNNKELDSKTIENVCESIKFLISPSCQNDGRAITFIQNHSVDLLIKMVASFRKLYCINGKTKAVVSSEVWANSSLQSSIIGCMLLLTLDACRTVKLFEISFLPRQIIEILMTLWIDHPTKSSIAVSVASQLVVVLEIYCRSCLTYKGVIDGEKLIETYDFMSSEQFEKVAKYKKSHDKDSVKLSYEKDVYINIQDLLERIFICGQRSIDAFIPYAMAEEREGKTVDIEKVKNTMLDTEVTDECSQLLSALSMLVVFPSVKVEFVQNAGFMQIASIASQSSIPEVISNCLGVMHATIFNLLDYESQCLLDEIAIAKKRFKKSEKENIDNDKEEEIDENSYDENSEDNEIDVFKDPKETGKKLTLFSLIISAFLAINPVPLFKTIIEKKNILYEISPQQYEKVIFAIIMIIHDGIHPETANDICNNDSLDIVLTYFIAISNKMQSCLQKLMLKEEKEKESSKNNKSKFQLDTEKKISIIEEINKITDLDDFDDDNNGNESKGNSNSNNKLTVTAIQRLKACIETLTKFISTISNIEASSEKNKKEKNLDKVEEVKVGSDMKVAKDNSNEFDNENTEVTTSSIFTKLVHSDAFIHAIVNYLFFASDIAGVKYAITILFLCGSYDLKNTDEADKWIRTDVDITPILKWTAHFGSEILQNAAEVAENQRNNKNKYIDGAAADARKFSLTQQLNILEDSSMAIVWLTESYLPKDNEKENNDNIDNTNKDSSIKKTKAIGKLHSKHYKEEKWIIYSASIEAKSLLLLSVALYSLNGALLMMPSFVSMIATLVSTEGYIGSVIKSLETQGENMVLKAKEQMKNQTGAFTKEGEAMLRKKMKEITDNRKSDIANFISGLAADLTKQGEHTYVICACLLFGLTLYPTLVRLCKEENLAIAMLSCAVINEIGPLIGILGAYVYTDEKGNFIDNAEETNKNDKENKENGPKKQHKIPHLIMSSAVKIINALKQVGDDNIASLLKGVLIADGVTDIDNVEITDITSLKEKK